MLNPRFLLLLTLAVFCLKTFAEGRPLIIFFGGKGATIDQVNQWKRAVQARMPDYDVEAIPYPRGASSKAESAVANGQAELSRLSAIINANPNRRVVIGGHSSGAALSNALAGKVRDPKNVKLVSIDGFAPGAVLQRRFQVECWSAVGSSGAPARNRNAMRSACGSRYREIQSTEPGCSTAWCLHFATFNRGANPYSNWSGGYGNMNPVLDWIGPSESISVASAPTTPDPMPKATPPKATPPKVNLPAPARTGDSTFMSGDLDLGTR